MSDNTNRVPTLAEAMAVRAAMFNIAAKVPPISALQETMADQIVELKAENARLKAEPPLGVHTDMFYDGECYLCKIWFGTNKNRKPLPIHDKFVLDAPEPRLCTYCRKPIASSLDEALINDDPYHHEAMSTGQTCYMKAQQPVEAEPRLTREGLDALIEKTFPHTPRETWTPSAVDYYKGAMHLRDALLADSPEVGETTAEKLTQQESGEVAVILSDEIYRLTSAAKTGREQSDTEFFLPRAQRLDERAEYFRSIRAKLLRGPLGESNKGEK